MRRQLINCVQRQDLRTFGSRFMTSSSHTRNSTDIGLEKNIAEKGEIQNSVFPSIEFPKTDVFTYALNSTKAWQHKVFTECAVTGRKYTFGQTMDSALRWGEALKQLLPKSGKSTIAFISTNSPDYVCMFLGTLAAGATITPFNPIYTPDEVAHQLVDSGADLLVVDAIFEPIADAAFKIMGKSLPVVVNGVSRNGRPNAQEILANPNGKMLDYTPIDPKSVAFLPYSSGTTGRPKGVTLTHESLVSNITMVANEHFGLHQKALGDYQEVSLGILPFFHIFGTVATLLPAIHYGAKIITMPKFDPHVFISLVKKNTITSFQIVPLLLRFMAGNELITSEDLQRTHSIICGAAPLWTDIAMAVKRKAPQTALQEGFGMTETLITHVTPPTNEKIGYCGQLILNVKAKVVDTLTGDILPANTPGELLIHSPSAMLGYHNNEAATKEAKDDEGWIRTGDIAFYTEDGFYSIVDRIKELIKVKGLQVSPTELEETLQKHPGIAEAGVVGIPDDNLGEAPVAFVVRSNDDVNEKEIHTFMEKHLAKHKQLAGGIKFVDELPKNATGKLLRRVLKSYLT